MNSYKTSQKIMHWSMALMIIVLLPMGYYMQDLPGQLRSNAYGLHKSFGVLVIFLLVLRVHLRRKHGAPALPKKFKIWESWLSHAVHYIIYILMLIMPLSGWVMSNAKGYPVKLFGIKMPDIAPKNEALGELASISHTVIAILFIWVLLLHFAGVLKHLIFDKENIVKRIG